MIICMLCLIRRIVVLNCFCIFRINCVILVVFLWFILVMGLLSSRILGFIVKVCFSLMCFCKL